MDLGKSRGLSMELLKMDPKYDFPSGFALMHPAKPS